MNEKEIRDILTRFQEIEKLQGEIRNLLPRTTNHVHIEKPKTKNQSLDKESSSTIRFPSLVTFPGIPEVSDVKRNDRLRSSKEVRSSMIDIKNKAEESLKNVTALKRASVNVIRDSSGRFNTSNRNLVNIPEQSAKLGIENLQSLHLKSSLSKKNSIKVPTAPGKVVNNPKIQASHVQNSTKPEKQKANNSKAANVGKGNHNNGEKLSEVTKKTKASPGKCVMREKSRKQSGSVRMSGNSGRTKKK
ncbi:hypothetical protein KPH14_007984 [Odynerus spinipes]|uniref:Uncharacterized protein n=1 Tax=Odynerus spinipes TaxID=1348599 RepID=A0AAD9VPC7_9HYME|nr:hypothetical protein KPH14_007984 [Odynerus spinipes]